MTRFRPCIDLHGGVVKQIVGASLRDGDEAPQTNYRSERPAEDFARQYREDDLSGGHVIQLGPGNEAAAARALAAWPGGLQLGGGVTPANARVWLERGASAVIVTSWVFHGGRFHAERLAEMVAVVGAERLVVDLSCAPRDGRYVVMTDRWQHATDFELSRESLASLAPSCAEFLVHAVELEGRRSGIDEQLVALLAEIAPRPTTYAGGVRDLADVETIERVGRGRIDYTVGSALDLFGGDGVRYADLVARDRRRR